MTLYQFDWSDFAKSVAGHREAEAVSRRKFAGMVGCSHGTISRVERGKPCDINTMLTICVMLRIDPMHLCHGDRELGE